MPPKTIHLIASFVVSIALLFSLAERAAAANLYVSPNGNDTHPGSEEKPLATLTAARDAARDIRGESITIYLDDGTHYLREPFILGAKDSGSKEHPVTYTAKPGCHPIISGGQRLQLKWTPAKDLPHSSGDGIFSAATPAGLTFDQLFVDHQRQPMARWPDYDPTSQYFQGFSPLADSPERAKRWSNPKDGFVHAMHRSLWGDMHWQITGKKASGELTLEGGWQNNRQMGSHKEYRFVENILEELDAPGEWFHDSANQRLYVYPTPSTNLDKAKVEVVRLKHLIEHRGTEPQPVHHITFRGITFTHAARTFMENKEPLLRSDWTTYRGGAVIYAGAEDCAVEECFLDQVGGNGIFVDKYNRRIRVTGCHIAGAGASAVSFVGDPKSLRSPLFEYQQKQTLEEMDKTPGPKTNNYPADCAVEDCLIYLNGRVEKQTAGVNICMAESITVKHCSIYDCPRAGINVCDGAFGGHLIEFCDVFDTVKETGDHGSFNAWGRDRFWHKDRGQTAKWIQSHPEMPKWDCHKPIVIRNNRFRCDHGWDIDLDDGSSNYELYNNLCLAGGIKLREGYFRNVYNNIMVDYTFCPHVWYPDCHTSFRNNIIFQEKYAPAGMKTTDQTSSIDHNLVHKSGAKSEPAQELAKWGSDKNSLVADAMFEDPPNGDYRVKYESPARKLGFRNFPMDQFGVENPKLKKIARTPPLPGTLAAAKVRSGGWGRKYKTPKSAQWMGITLKTIDTDGEMSSVGLGDKNGVLVAALAAKPAANQPSLKENDVIRAVNDQDVKDLSQFSAAFTKQSQSGSVTLKVWRDQADVSIAVP